MKVADFILIRRCSARRFRPSLNAFNCFAGSVVLPLPHYPRVVEEWSVVNNLSKWKNRGLTSGVETVVGLRLPRASIR